MRLLACLLVFSTALSAQNVHTVEQLAGTQVQYLLERAPAMLTATDSADLERTRQTLINLHVVADVTYTRELSDGGDTLIHWTVEEANTVFPLIGFGGLRDNFFFLLGAKDINWRGRGNTLESFYQNIEGEHNFRLAIANPHLRGSPWGYYTELQRYAAREPLYFPATVNYNYVNLSGGVGVSYTPRNGLTYRSGVNVFREDYQRLDDIPLGPESLTLTKFLIKLTRDNDRRDYFGERQSGWYNTSVLQSVLTGGVGQAAPFFIGWHELRYYRLTGQRGNFALRLRAGLSSNDATPFAPFVLDSQFNIRGIGNRIDRGTAQLVLNVEYRHSLFRDGRGRFVLQGVIFSDLGSWRSPGGELSELVARSSLKHFVGGGVRLASPRVSSAVVRFDYGVDVAGYDRRGFVIGFGQFF